MTAVDGPKICIVGINYAPEQTGIAPYTSALAEALTESGAHVHVVTGIPHYPQWSIADEKYESGRYWHEDRAGVRITRCAHYVPSHPTLKARMRMELSFLRRALPVVAREKSEAVIAVTPSLSGLAAAVLGGRRRPVGAIVQDLTGNAAGQSGTSGDRAASLIGKVEYRLLSKCAQIGVITPRFAEVLIENGIPGDNIQAVPNFSHIKPIDTDRSDARRVLGWPVDGFTVVHTGNMGRKQGLETPIGAARIAHANGADLRLVLVGDGNQRGKLELLAQGIPNVSFVPPLEESVYPLALAAADVLLLSERAGVKEMSMPSKLTSYAAANRPILASIDSDGITYKQLSRYDASRNVRAGDEQALFEALVSLRESPSSMRRIVAGAKSMRDDLYSEDRAYRRYVRFAEALTQRRSARTRSFTIAGSERFLEKSSGTPALAGRRRLSANPDGE